MLDTITASRNDDVIAREWAEASLAIVASPRQPAIESMLQGVPVQRRGVRRKQTLFYAGQPCHSLFLIHAGVFKTTVLSEDGRRKITGFHLRGDLLGMDSFGAPVHACDAVALDTGEVWEIPLATLRDHAPELLPHVTTMLASEIRRDWNWMLTLGTLNAEQRVVAFLLDFAARVEALGFSARHLLLRMTRADIGNFLALQLETVTRILSRLAATGLIVVDGREVRIEDAGALRRMLVH
ncbi:helix-turn-helix domain-containing protein [Vulcaniibacterium gelatinicum]|uniref:helix-turn-helix domain-containing protein n=1 Tax=Vulcaniibacterium gelatinicum TaxID=2598725 RepID=UPI0015F2C1A5|nr:helix-turn-helix domain-containing protein [Vulcaniibacterium gelatinicum]